MRRESERPENVDVPNCESADSLCSAALTESGRSSSPHESGDFPNEDANNWTNSSSHATGGHPGRAVVSALRELYFRTDYASRPLANDSVTLLPEKGAGRPIPGSLLTDGNLQCLSCIESGWRRS